MVVLVVVYCEDQRALVTKPLAEKKVASLPWRLGASCMRSKARRVRRVALLAAIYLGVAFSSVQFASDAFGVRLPMRQRFGPRDL
jgi:hypothetical protein